MRIKINNHINHLIIFLLLATSGMPFFRGQQFMILGVLLIGFVYVLRKRTLSPFFVGITSVFVIVEAIQYVYFDGLGLRTIAGTYLRIILVYLAIASVGREFIPTFIRQMYSLSVISLVLYPVLFYTPALNFLLYKISPFFTPPFAESGFYSASPNLLVYTIHELHSFNFRNSGPFWEPGGFAVFLLIATMFQLQRNDVKYDKYVLVFIISLFTTISTAAYLGLLILFFILHVRKSNVYLKFVAIPTSLILGFVIIQNVEFLGEKIQQNIEISDFTTASRFGSALADIQLFYESPIIGWGRGNNRYGLRDTSQYTIEEHRNNGLTNIYVTYGIFLGTFILFLYYKGFNRFRHTIKTKENLTPYYFAIILIISFSQVLFFRPFILSLLFLPVVYNKRLK